MDASPLVLGEEKLSCHSSAARNDRQDWPVVRMHHTSFDFDFDRTAFSDDNYSVVGRALTLAQKFEGDCKALNSLFRTKSAVETGELLLDDEDAFTEFTIRLHKLSLGKHLHQLAQYSEITALTQVFDKARTSRNFIAHDLCLGIQRVVETEEGRGALIRDVRQATRNISVAHLTVLILMAYQNDEVLPSSDYLQSYLDRVTDWVCGIGDE